MAMRREGICRRQTPRGSSLACAEAKLDVIYTQPSGSSRRRRSHYPPSRKLPFPCGGSVSFHLKTDLLLLPLPPFFLLFHSLEFTPKVFAKKKKKRAGNEFLTIPEKAGHGRSNGDDRSCQNILTEEIQELQDPRLSSDRRDKWLRVISAPFSCISKKNCDHKKTTLKLRLFCLYFHSYPYFL